MPTTVEQALVEQASGDVRAELNRILSSPEFRGAERLTRFLRHIVEQTLHGDVQCLKEVALGGDIFGRRDFDPRVDPIVRVEASRLRKRLDDFYRRSGCPNGLMIILPRGSYTASFERRVAGPSLSQSSPGKGVRRAAVLPLRSNGLEDVAETVGEALVSQLTKTGLLEVAVWSAGAVSESEGVAAAREMGVHILVAGSLRRHVEGVTVSLRAIDVSAGTYLWAETVDGSEAIPAIVQIAVSKVLETAAGRPGGAGLHAASRRLLSPDSYNLYLKGRYYWRLRSEAGLRKAVDYFQQAVEQDPECALAFTGLADAYTLLANYGASAPDEVRPKAKEFALRAMEIDATLAEAHTSLAHVHSTYEWDWHTADLEYQTAIRLNPSYATAHHWYGITLLAPLRRLDEALEEIRRARECDSISLSIRRDEALVLLYRGDAEAGLEMVTQLLALDSHFAGAWWVLGMISEFQGRHESAIDAFSRAVELSARQPRMLGALGHAFGVAGSRTEAAALLAELEMMPSERYVSPFDVALVNLGLGRCDVAFSHLNRALSLRSYELVTLQVDPRYAALRPSSGYDELRRMLGF